MLEEDTDSPAQDEELVAETNGLVSKNVHRLVPGSLSRVSGCRYRTEILMGSNKCVAEQRTLKLSDETHR